jgi:hypothetical protein
MNLATRHPAEEIRLEHHSAVLNAPFSARLRRWLTGAWAGRKQRRIERLVLEISHPGAIAEMRRARGRQNGYAAWN